MVAERDGQAGGPVVAPDGRPVPRVIEAGADACGPFLVTGYAAGPSLAAHVDRHGPVSGDRLHGLAAGLAEAR